jgi:hypothetical protein
MPADDAIESNALAALVQCIVDRNVAALEALYDRYCAGVFGFASRLLGGHVEASEQAVEEVFWQLWRQAPRLIAAEPAACAQALRKQLNEWTLAAAAQASERHGLPPVSLSASSHPARAMHAHPPSTEQTA